MYSGMMIWIRLCYYIHDLIVPSSIFYLHYYIKQPSLIITQVIKAKTKKDIEAPGGFEAADSDKIHHGQTTKGGGTRL